MSTSVENRRTYYTTLEYGVVEPLKSISSKTSFISNSSNKEDDENYLNMIKNIILNGRSEVEPSVLDPRDEGTADHWIQRNPSLIRLTGKHPFNSEPPLQSLMHHGFITPVQLHYVRNHGHVPKARWEDWTIEVTGLVKNPTQLTMDQLVNDFPSREFPVTLVCSANRRKEQNLVKQTIGFNWGPSATSTSVWRGVPLRNVLKRCGIYSRNNGALYVCFEGAEELPGGGGSKYGTSILCEVALDRTRDIILAYMQNGDVLSPDHGFPVRVIVPGFTAGRMVKWLKRIIVTTKESDSYYHYHDNRLLPSHVDAELANTEAWFYKPEYIINELNINSAITTPSHGEILAVNSDTTQIPYLLKGYAYSGGGRKVTRVEVTIDGGETWKVCKLEHPEKPSKYGKYWCWCFWSLEVEVLDLFGAKEISVRAWDLANNTQPENLNWNLMGMMNNCWFRVKTNVYKPHKGEIGIMFEHPTQPGNQSGGWMVKQKEEVNKKSSISDPTPMKTNIVSSSPQTNTTSSKVYTMSEVEKHNNSDSAWIIVDGHVYNCTHYLKDHPGGVDSILINAGTDCTEEFEAIHSDKAKKMLEDYLIGKLVTNDTNGNNVEITNKVIITQMHNNVALNNPRDKITCKLVSKRSISHNVRIFRFALPYEDQLLGLPVGKHLFLCDNIEKKLCMRAFTPTSGVDEKGYFDLVVKIYFKGVHPKYPNGGLMSQHLDSLSIGSILDIKGPLGHIEYNGKGNFLVHGEHKFANKLTMLAGGTGITPIYQVVQAILKDPEDLTEMHVVYANRSEDDILLREEMDEWAMKHERFKVWYVVQESKREGWEYSVGFITKSILMKHVPEASEDTLALACGQPPMIEGVKSNLEKLGYDIKNNLLVF
ncbi:nitrate reductase [Trifolium pratense]|uniref:Nitrate reductase n=1 Tax=Trifolium pratense TaxID=57577 RepID=A0A2K3PEF1_TRIPR|nr:nitrate reductase [Trifolium pratense]